jgi:hypothetical protein
MFNINHHLGLEIEKNTSISHALYKSFAKYAKYFLFSLLG